MRRTNQRFQQGDLVRIREEIPWIRSGAEIVAYRYDSGKRAVIKGSYDDQYGGGATMRKTYTVIVEGSGPVSWYDEDDLTLIEEGRFDLFEEWSKGHDDPDD